MIKGLLSRLALTPVIALALMGAAPTSSIYASLPEWEVFKFSDSCVLINAFTSKADFTIMVNARYPGYFVSLKAKQWTSITEGQDVNIVANFEHKSLIIAPWPINATGHAGGGGLTFHTELSDKDGELSFPELFATSEILSFEHDQQSILALNLKNSYAALLNLEKCRSAIRNQPDFDPFAPKD